MGGGGQLERLPARSETQTRQVKVTGGARVGWRWGGRSWDVFLGKGLQVSGESTRLEEAWGRWVRVHGFTPLQREA